MTVHKQCMNFGCQNDHLMKQCQQMAMETVELRKQCQQMAMEIVELKKGNTMNSYALWCSAGEHAFDPYDPERKKTTVEDADGNEIVVMTCGKHTPDVLKQARAKGRHHVIEKGYDGEDY